MADLENLPLPEEAASLAEKNFLSGYNCAQAVFCTFASCLGVEQGLARKMSLALGGGMCRSREVCGTVNGMLLALGCLEGSETSLSKEIKDSVYAHGQELMNRFKKEHGSIECRELLGLVPMGISQKMLEASKQKIPLSKLFSENQTESENENQKTSTVAGDALDSKSEERTADYYKRRPCAKLCASAAYIFATYLSESLKKEKV